VEEGEKGKKRRLTKEAIRGEFCQEHKKGGGDETRLYQEEGPWMGSEAWMGG